MSNQSKQNENKGRMVLLAGAILQLFLGIIYVWSVLAVPVSNYFKWELSSAKLTSSFMLCFFVIGILVGGKLINQFKSQLIVAVGGVLLSIGMLITAFLPLGYGGFIYITYGIIGGFGVGMAYNAIITAAQKWFPKRRGLATGVSVSAFGFSTVIFAPLIEYLTKTVDVKITFVILSVSFFAIVLALFSFIKLPNDVIKLNTSMSATVTTNDYTVKDMLKTKEFYFITLSLMFATSVFFILNPSFKTLAVERGLSPMLATLLVMITGVSNALGRLAVPFISDKVGRERATFLIIAVTSIGAILLCFSKGLLLLAIIAIVAFCYGGFSGVYPVLTGDYFGLKNVGSNYGAVMIGFAMSALFFPILVNCISNSIAKFVVLALLSAIGAIFVLLLKKK